MPIKIHNQASTHGLSWFVTSKAAVLWIGRSGQEYPESFELWPVCTKPRIEPGVDFALLTEGKKMMKYFTLNPHYFKIEISMKWSKL